jgi:20S proteasome subunit alpha 6
MAIGARSQSARTYLEKNLDKFADCNQDELIKHCMRALRDTLPNEVELTVKVTNQILYILIRKKIIFF